MALLRIDGGYGAELVIESDVARAFELAEEIAEEEGRLFVHPFEGENVTQASAGVGLELMEDVPDLDAVIVAIGGGGLASGVGSAVKALNPECEVYGVEPEGASSMYQSFERGELVALPGVNTIADSLAPTRSAPYAFGVCREVLDDICLVSDEQIAAAMQEPGEPSQWGSLPTWKHWEPDTPD